MRRPQEFRGEEFYVLAYARLSSERNHFPGEVGPVPWNRINTYGQTYKLTALMHEWFVDLMMLVDRLYIERMDRERERKRRRKDRKAKREAKRKKNALGSPHGIGSRNRR